jgi:pimeloyl-ACP methyl ester carboxylesterase
MEETMKPDRTMVATLLALLLGAACAPDEPLAPAAAPNASYARAATGPQDVTGETGQGALYSLSIPAQWNGSLVLYVHGIRDASLPLTLDNGNQDDVLGLRTGLLAQGYAFAYSSFSENGWAVRDGAQTTHQLRGLFAARYGSPVRTYVIGHSMGALIATKLVETHPAHYDGVLPVCGILGGGPATISYIGNIRLLFDFHYPGVLPGSVVDPAGAPLLQVVGSAQAAMLANPSGAFAIAAIMQRIGMPLPVMGTTPAEQMPTLIGTILNGLGFHVRGFEDLTERTHGRPPFDNVDTDYGHPVVQAGVPRYRAHPDAVKYLERWYEPTGRLSAPMLTLDPMFDPVAPLFHKDLYATAAARAGNADRLARRVVPTFGHCAVPTAATVAAFNDLVHWVDTGARP